jgi:Zn-dependent protease
MSTDTIYSIVALIIAMVLHELAHGVAARLLGDPTAASAGRLTLNPLKHVDPQGSLLVPGLLAAGQIAALGHISFLYGWAKPVPVNALELRWRGQPHPRQLMALVAFAGPATNFALALIGGLLFNMAPDFFLIFILINLGLGLFNLLPIPPMDGGRIAVGLLPLPAARLLARTEKFGILAVLGLLVILPAILRNSGVAFDPIHDAYRAVIPWATTIILQWTGHGGV